MKTILCALVLAAAAINANAGETGWQQVDEETRVRMIFSDERGADGTTWAALEIDMPADTKTYWRVPGESGIPATLDISGSRGVSAAEVVWPFPTRETRKGFLDHVYYGHVVLPLKLATESETPAIAAEATLGVCSDVCVPVVARFNHSLSFAKPDAGQGLRIDQALAQTPLPWTADGEPFGAAVFDPEAGRVAVALTDPAFAHETAIAAIAGEMTLFGPGEVDSGGRRVHFPVFGNGSLPDLAGKALTLTFMTPGGPYEITREISAP